MREYVKYAAVQLEAAVDKILDYGIPSPLISQAERGALVEVPVRGAMRRGYILDLKDTPDFSPVQSISKILSREALITNDLFELALWISKYYCAPLRQVFKCMLPASVRRQVKAKQQLFVMRAKTREELRELCESIRTKSPAQAMVLETILKVKKGMLLTELLEASQASRAAVDALTKKGALLLDIVRVDRSPLLNEQYFKTKAKELNPDQSQALKKIETDLTSGSFGVHLLFGVTGSGKTEVYIRALEKALSMGKGAIILVPEIALTAQTIERFRSRFEDKMAVLHHRLSDGERLDEWEKIRSGEARIVIGARSAVFSPVTNLGLIIVDEEHEHTYKQTEEAPCYHARDVAVMRAKIGKSVALLGSATPSLESYHNGIKGKYTLSKLHLRADAAQMPKFTIVDMKREYERNKGYTNFSEILLEGIKKRIEAGEQSILFLNRRGYHTTLFCPQCRKAVSCAHCDTSLTFHLGENRLACHLCGFAYSPPPRQCPSCRAPDPMKFRGVGTEQIQKALHAILPDIRTLRIDADTTKHKGSHQKLLREFGSGKADVLIGTQMIAKGLHFPSVTLVGVLNSDTSLNIPDFRASEQVFQLITQVAGRAGRGAIAGEVIVQTSIPDNETIQLAAAQDFEQFYTNEIPIREAFKYPPFSSLAKFAFSGTHQEKTKLAAESLRHKLMKLLPETFELLPVIPAGHARVKDRFRFQFIIKGPHIYTLNQALEKALQETHLAEGMRLLVDINPSSTFF